MPNLAVALRSEIRRLAAREAGKTVRVLRRVQRQLKALRLAARGQRRVLSSVERRLARVRVTGPAAARAKGGRRGRPVTPQSMRGLRDRLGMTRLRFAKLLGVSPGSIFGWETGRTVPRGKSLARMAEVRKMGLRAARAQVSGAARRSGRRRRRARRK